MTNTELLKQYIERSGLKLGYIAERLYISRSTLYQKIENKSDFRQKEIKLLCAMLHIDTAEEQSRIFLA